MAHVLQVPAFGAAEQRHQAPGQGRYLLTGLHAVRAVNRTGTKSQGNPALPPAPSPVAGLCTELCG